MNSHSMVRREDRGAVALVILDDPATRNALPREAIRAVADHVEQAATDDNVRAIVITGGAKSFSSGAALSPAGVDDNQDESDAPPPIMADVTAMITAVVGSPVPVIAAVEGSAAGVGASLAFSCDLLVAAESAFFLLPFGRLGLIPDGGVMRTALSALGRSRTMSLALRQQRLPAGEAQVAGLVGAVVPDGEALTTAIEWAESLRGSSRGALAETKRWINDAALPGLRDWLDAEAVAQAALLRGEDYREGVAAFVEKRAPRF